MAKRISWTKEMILTAAKWKNENNATMAETAKKFGYPAPAFAAAYFKFMSDNQKTPPIKTAPVVKPVLKNPKIRTDIIEVPVAQIQAFVAGFLAAVHAE